MRKFYINILAYLKKIYIINKSDKFAILNIAFSETVSKKYQY